MTNENLKSQTQDVERLAAVPCSFFGFRWSVAVGSQPPVACYVDSARELQNDPGDPKHERWLRYQTLDGDATGWRQEGSIRPLASEQDWHDLKNAQFTHKLEMARQFTEENAELTRPEPHDKSHE